MFIRFINKIVPLLFVIHVYAVKPDSSLTYYQLGLEAAKNSKFEISEKYLNKAIESAKYDSLKASIFTTLGINYGMQGKYQNAMGAYNHALNFTNDLELLSKIYSNQGIITKTNGNYQKALLLYNKALEATKDQKQASLIYNNIANIFYLIKDFEKALTYYTESLELKKEFDPLNISYSYLNIALCYQALKKGDKAEQYFNKAIREIINIYGNNHYLLIKAYANYGNFLINTQPEKSFNLLSKANSLAILNYGNKHTETAKTWMYLGNYYVARGEYEKGLAHYQKALIANSKGFDNLDLYQNPTLKNPISELQQLEILHQKGIAFQKYATTLKTQDKELKISLATYELAIETLFKLQNSFMDESKRALIANKKDMFAEAANVAIQLKDYPKAFQLVEKGKASTLLAAINNNEAIKFSDIPDSLVVLENEYKRLQFVYSASENADSSLYYQAKYDSLTAYFEARYPKYHQLKYSQKITDPCKQLDTSQVLLEYALTDTLCVTLVVTKEGYRHYSFRVDSVFNENLETFILCLKGFSREKNRFEEYNKYTSSAYYLYKNLFAPLNIPAGKELVIVPDGMLAHVPFEALLCNMPPPGNDQYYNLDYLLYRHPASYGYSTGLFFGAYTGKPQKTLGGFAPGYDNRENLMPLGNMEEVKKIKKMFPGHAYLGGKATKKAFMENAAKYEILVLNMHGMADFEDGMGSRLAFSDEDLYAYEIYGMKLNARLVVSNACNAGNGPLCWGEGLMSAARAFAYAGCPCSVMPLWVYKNHMGKLGTSFLGLYKKGLPVNKALQQAKINHVKEMFDAHPHYWASLVLNGNPTNAKISITGYPWHVPSLIVLVCFCLIYFIDKKFRVFAKALKLWHFKRGKINCP